MQQMNSSAALRIVSSLPGRSFRSVLKTAVVSGSFELALEILDARRSNNSDILPDDYGFVLSNCINFQPVGMISKTLIKEKYARRLNLRTEDELLDLVKNVLEKWDTGIIESFENDIFRRYGTDRTDNGKVEIDLHEPVTKKARINEGVIESLGITKTPSSTVSTLSDVTSSELKRLSAEEKLKEMEIESKLYADLMSSIVPKVLKPEYLSKFKVGQYKRALSIFESMISSSQDGLVAITPNARSYVLMLYCHLENEQPALAKECLGKLKEMNLWDRLYEVMQPSLIIRLESNGLLLESERRALLEAEENTEKWYFLKAAYEASKGDQFGAKHGAVVTKNGKYLSHGRNHRFKESGTDQVRVMHSEVHAIARLQEKDPSLVRGADCYIVELDGYGIGYEEAVPCQMCMKGLLATGIKQAIYSSHHGIVKKSLNYKPNLECETLLSAMKREYPDGTYNPDVNDSATFDFKEFKDPGGLSVVWGASLNRFTV